MAMELLSIQTWSAARRRRRWRTTWSGCARRSSTASWWASPGRATAGGCWWTRGFIGFGHSIARAARGALRRRAAGRAIVMTHCAFRPRGRARASCAEAWDAPVYAHPLEHPLPHRPLVVSPAGPHRGRRASWRSAARSSRAARQQLGCAGARAPRRRLGPGDAGVGAGSSPPATPPATSPSGASRTRC